MQEYNGGSARGLIVNLIKRTGVYVRQNFGGVNGN